MAEGLGDEAEGLDLSSVNEESESPCGILKKQEHLKRDVLKVAS